MSKKLVQAASNLLSDCNGYDVGLLCGYILDTVREDDDVPLSVDWFVALTDAVNSESGLIASAVIAERRVTLIRHEEELHHFSIDRNVSDREWVSLCGACIATRGQLRTLCRIFGVTLPEGGAQ